MNHSRSLTSANGVAPGDSAPIEAVARLAKGADILVHEAMYVPALEAYVHDRIAKGSPIRFDDYMAHMLAYPGRTFGQLYHRFFIVNDLADGKFDLGESGCLDLADVKLPVLVVAGKNDVLAPKEAVEAVTNLSFAIPRGGSLALIGESGSGKTTTARMVVGLEMPTAGEVRVAGKVVAPRPNTQQRR